jgi:hypothetical protein
MTSQEGWQGTTNFATFSAGRSSSPSERTSAPPMKPPPPDRPRADRLNAYYSLAGTRKNGSGPSERD